MAETKVEQPKAPPPPDWEAAESVIKQIEDELAQYVGKAGFNPYLWKRDNNWDKIVADCKAKKPEAFTALITIKRPIDCSVNLGVDTRPLVTPPKPPTKK